MDTFLLLSTCSRHPQNWTNGWSIMSKHRLKLFKNKPGWWARATPLKNMSSSIGMISNPIYGKIETVPNHQPETVLKHRMPWTMDMFFCNTFPNSAFSTRCSFSSHLSAAAKWHFHAPPPPQSSWRHRASWDRVLVQRHRLYRLDRLRPFQRPHPWICEAYRDGVQGTQYIYIYIYIYNIL